MKKEIEIPDETIEMAHGDRVNIYVREKDILFDFFCDGTGNCFAIPKEELKEIAK